MTPSTARSTGRSLSKRILVVAGLAAALSFSFGCSQDANDDNNQPSIPAGGETGTNPGPTLSPNGETVPPTT